jgi:hypothetical protein
MTPAKRAWSLSLSAIAILVIVYGVSLYQPHGAFAPSESESSQSESVNEEAIRSSGDKSERADDGVLGRDQKESPEDTEAHRSKDAEDEAYVREMVRKVSIEKTRKRYSLLIEKLELTPAEIDALFEFLVEDTIASTKTAYSDGLGIDEDERLARLEEILSDEKLQQFLAYERNLGDFRELHSVQSMLQQKGVPLTEAQRDGVLEILIDVRKQLDPKRPSHIERGSMEDLEYTLGQLDEYDRLVTELASSVLSAKQVEYMFERNQKYSYERASQLEWHKERLAANPDDDMLLWYVPKGE